ncbi:MAG TPA: M24 family metallopeptidase [Gemmataceae bacterium]|jgi:Xaa-Pro aminopeptidase|nr:M24 family metallopeptidase [Gemmataceae bacterium]
MSSAAESIIRAPDQATQINVETTLDRRVDIDAKQGVVAGLLREAGCDGLLVVEPANFAWLTSGATARGILDPTSQPALYFSPEQRWAIAANVDSQRLFDEELDGLGFQLKEWPWHWGREQLLTDLCQGRKVACDRAFGGTKVVTDQLRKLRRVLSAYEQACLRAVGHTVSHALEATCRTLLPNQTERECAGQLSHRLLHRGAQPVAISVAADGRSGLYRHCGYTEVLIRRHAVLMVTARKYGLHVTASRSVSFGPPEDLFRQEHEAVCKIHATYVASSWPDAGPREVLSLGRRVYLITGYEHEWLGCPQGYATGRSPVELVLTPQTEELFQAGWAVTWRAVAGAATSCDTFLITDKGPELITATEAWPLKRIRIQGADFIRPYLLERPVDEPEQP